MTNVRKLYKAGNSTVVAIPNTMLWQLKSKVGDAVKFRVDVQGDVRITAVKWKKELTEVKNG